MRLHLALFCLFSVLTTSVFAQDAPPALGVYPYRMQPQDHPDYHRRWVQPPTAEVFGDRTRFVTLRGFGVVDDKIVNIASELDKYTVTHDLGDIIWPSYSILFGENLDELAREIKKRNLLLFDVWGYVPGSGPGGYWQQFEVPAGVFDLLESTLGDHWLGMDVGEQDGRYIGGYANQMHPISQDRFAQYLNFQHHFQRMCDDLGNKMSTLVSLNFGHYLLKEGVYTTIGAETAQALPNSQVYYAFIRGAGKQYGVPWFGNASVWNRWGWKTYEGSGDDHGPEQGTSLSLLKRLLYSHIFYNSAFVGFESSWFEGDKLSPVGLIQQSAKQWVAEHGDPGTLVAPVALMLGFDSGWTFPRHLYTNATYRVWGNLPYDVEDHFVNGVIDMFYPGYQDASYFHDERGFLSPTPYGDSLDCILSDAEPWLLNQYSVIVCAVRQQDVTRELADKLRQYVAHGGHLVLPTGAAAALNAPFESSPGLVSILEGELVARDASVAAITNEIDQPLANPIPLTDATRAVLDSIFAGTRIFDAGEGISLITCRRGQGDYTLCLANNSLEPKPFRIQSFRGEIASIEELVLDQSEKSAIGYLPTGFADAAVGQSADTTIAGGDTRIFRVQIAETGVTELPQATPPPRPKGRVLPVHDARTIQEFVLARPTFFEHFDGVLVDGRYLRERDKTAVADEAGWIKRQGLAVYVDATSSINLYPDLRLVDNSEMDYAQTQAWFVDVLDKMHALGAKHLVLSLHRVPENNITVAETYASFDQTLQWLSNEAAQRDVTLLLRTSPRTGLAEVLGVVSRVGADNLLLAPSLAHALNDAGVAGRLKEVADKIGLWCVGAPGYDEAGSLWSCHLPLTAGIRPHQAQEILGIAHETPCLLDVAYTPWDGEYGDARALEELRP
ncbi:MAG: hypothetical protein IT368_11095 [Candidatus Hydrogenedentes bacterium]|nr:hypothetical protein [Candidatus Hydrogenedentota bacterium]